jgi:hypothetical protein
MWKKKAPPLLNVLKTKAEKVNASPTHIDQIGPNTWEKRAKKKKKKKKQAMQQCFVVQGSRKRLENAVSRTPSGYHE